MPVCKSEMPSVEQMGIKIQKREKLKIPNILNLANTTLFKEKRDAISNSFIPYAVDFALSVIRSKARKGINADTIQTVFSFAQEAPHNAGNRINADNSHIPSE